jgi:hypothetical protein
MVMTPNLPSEHRSSLAGRAGKFVTLICLGILLQLISGGRAFAAEIFFNHVYKGIPIAGGYVAETNYILISSATLVSGRNFSFQSLNPADPAYSGNNVPGFLKYIDPSGNYISIRG